MSAHRSDDETPRVSGWLVATLVVLGSIMALVFLFLA
jgi:hypothetical protein